MTNHHDTPSCINIAQHFLACAKDRKLPGLLMTRLQLMVYFANGWYFGAHRTPLCKENPIATEAGPRYRELYDYFQRGDLDTVSTVFASRESLSLFEPSDAIQQVLDEAWDNYAEKDLGRMIRIANRFDDPWHRTWHRHQHVTEIKAQTLHDHYFFFLYLASNGLRY